MYKEILDMLIIHINTQLKFRKERDNAWSEIKRLTKQRNELLGDQKAEHAQVEELINEKEQLKDLIR
jgi:hypothetical protein